MRARNRAKPATIDEYIDAMPEPAHDVLGQIRAVCTAAVPTADEQIKWGHPAYVHPDGVILYMFSGHKEHASVAFTPTTRAAFGPELAGYETGKGTIALPYDSTVPVDLLRRMIEHRVREYEHHGIKWL